MINQTVTLAYSLIHQTFARKCYIEHQRRRAILMGGARNFIGYADKLMQSHTPGKITAVKGMDSHFHFAFPLKLKPVHYDTTENKNVRILSKID